MSKRQLTLTRAVEENCCLQCGEPASVPEQANPPHTYVPYCKKCKAEHRQRWKHLK